MFDLDSNEYTIENILGDIPESWYNEVVSSTLNYRPEYNNGFYSKLALQ